MGSQLLSARLARIRTLASVAMLGLLTVACAAPPQRLYAGPDPADADARVAPTAYRPALGGYVSQRPVGPGSWREQNERVAPAEKR